MYLIMAILYHTMLYRHMQVHHIHVINILNYTSRHQPICDLECSVQLSCIQLGREHKKLHK